MSRSLRAVVPLLLLLLGACAPAAPPAAPGAAAASLEEGLDRREWVSALPPPVPVAGRVIRLEGQAFQGFKVASLAEPGCLAAALAGDSRLAGLATKVRFAVLRDGRLARFSLEARVDPVVEGAVEAAFRACRWEPARDPQGEPLAVWVVQPIRVAGTAP
jgi:hypothetical protein